MANLSWTASTETSWIHINPTTGTGSQNVTIRTDKAGYGETNLTGEVTFNGSDGSVRTVQVTRCKETECEVGSVEYTFPTDGSSEAEACQATVNVNIPFTAVTHYSTPGCEDDTVTGFSAVTYTIGKNETDGPIDHVKRIGNTSNLWIIHQKPGPCDCDCNALYILVGSTNYGWQWNMTAGAACSLYVPECVTSLNAVCDNEHFSVRINVINDVTWVEFVPKEENTTGEDIKGIVTVSYKANGKNCSMEITLNHFKRRTQPCHDYNISPTSGNINGNCTGGTVTFTATIQQ